MSDRSIPYVFGAAQFERIHAAEELFDAGTKRRITALGVAPGASCLEVGAGGGSIARWLCEVVGNTGQVIATDIDVQFLEYEEPPPHLEIRQHDVVKDPLEEHRFDLVHARLVLGHLAERDVVLAKLIRALRPGGWLVVEDLDYVSAIPISERGAAEHARTQSVRLEEFAKSGVASYFGRELPVRLRSGGLNDVGNEGHVWVMEGGSPGARWFQLSMDHVRGRLVGPGKLTDEEVDRMLAFFDDPGWSAFSPILITAWGRTPL